MDFNLSIPDIETRLKAHAIGVDEFCETVGIHRATWQRWKAGKYEPRLEAWKRVIAAVPPELNEAPPKKRASAA